MKKIKLHHILLGLLFGGSLAVGAGKIVNGDISATAAIAFSKLASLTNTHILVGSAGGVATDVALSGDATLANTGALTIANLAVNNAKIAASTIDLTAKVTGVLPVANGGTSGATATAAFDALSPCSTQGDIAYYNGSHWVCLATDTDGKVLTTHGAGANPTYTTISSTVNAGVYSGTMVGVGGGWTNGTNTAYVDFSAASTSNTLTQTVSNNITCSADAGKTPAIDCTLPATGNYFVCAIGTATGNTGAALIRLVDGSAAVVNGGQEFNDAVAGQGGPFSLCGFYSAAGTSVTFKLQGAAPAGNSAVYQDSQRPITWSVAQFK